MKYFKESEFYCKCGCYPSKMDDKLMDILDDIRDHFNTPVFVSSGYRCEEHNEYVGGVKNSKHVLGIASDIVVRGVPSSEVYIYVTNKYPNELGVGRYTNFTHIDTRPKKARWYE